MIFTNYQTEFSFLAIAKIGLLLFLLIYMIFAFLVIRQVRLMTETLELGFEDLIRFIAFAHFVLSIVVFIAGLFIL